MVQFIVAECRCICGGRLGALVAEAESIYCGRPEASASEGRKRMQRKAGSVCNGGPEAFDAEGVPRRRQEKRKAVRLF